MSGIQIQLREQAARIRAEQGEREPLFHDLSLDLTTCRLTARLRVLQGKEDCRLIMYRPAKLNGPDMLRLWLRHLAATAAGLCVDSIHIGKDHAEQAFQPPQVNQKQAASILQELILLYQAGMHAPLPFFPRTSLAYAQRRFAEKDNEQDKALAKAQEAWLGGYKTEPEREDPFLRVVYQDTEPDWDRFAAVTEAVYGPLLGGGHAD